MSYGNKVDANHADLRDNVFRMLAKQVIDTSNYGMGFADLIVLFRDGDLCMVEIKDGAKPRSKRLLTPMQQDVARRFGDKFLVAIDERSAEEICKTGVCPRSDYSGLNYIEGDCPWRP